jgi:hypothetical protein
MIFGEEFKVLSSSMRSFLQSYLIFYLLGLHFFFNSHSEMPTAFYAVFDPTNCTLNNK